MAANAYAAGCLLSEALIEGSWLPDLKPEELPNEGNGPKRDEVAVDEDVGYC